MGVGVLEYTYTHRHGARAHDARISQTALLLMLLARSLALHVMFTQHKIAFQSSISIQYI